MYVCMHGFTAYNIQMQYKIETRQIALLHFQQVDLCQASPENLATVTLTIHTMLRFLFYNMTYFFQYLEEPEWCVAE